MTSLPHSIEQKPEAGEGTIPLSTAASSTNTAPPKPGRGMNTVLVFLVLTLAFLSASFLASNSDLWFHLATGRLLARGEFSFGADPFAYTTQNVYWACHSWLFDWALFVVRDRIGAAGLVVLKALLIAGLAGLMLCIRRPSASLWLSAVCTTLAILAMSQRLLLQPACISYVLLGITLWLLWKQRQRAGSIRNGKTSLALTSGSLLLLFILWVNVDEWFFLGPLLTAFFWLGDRLEGQRRTPGWLVPAGFAVCLLNPYTYHAFTLPAELSIVPWTSGLRQDARFQTVFASPWNARYFHAAAHLHAAVLAYYALTFLGLTSFVLQRPALRDWRIVVWLPFALLAAWQARLVPFFAIVAAPITALNLQDIVSIKYEGQIARSQILLGFVRLLLLLSLLALLALTWLGWLAGYDREERHVAWGFQEDPSLRQAAETLELWHNRGLLPEGERIFALAPEAAHYGDFFCPEKKHFFDHRYPLFAGAAREYEIVCSALLGRPSDKTVSGKETKDQRSPTWQQVLSDRKVGIVVVYDRDWQRLFPILNRLSNDRENWTLLHVAGQAFIAGWNKARPHGGFDSLAFDPDQLAYAPPDGKTQNQAPPAPEQGPALLPPPRRVRDRLIHAPATPSWESAAATAYLYYFQNSEAAQHDRQKRHALFRYAASLTALPVQPSGATQAAAQLVSARKLLFPEEASVLFREDLGPFFASLADRPSALPLLSVRAARRAVAADPSDANAWLRLGQAYLILRNLTCERSAEGLLPPLAQLRQVQIVTALEQAIRLDPNLEAAHQELALLYGAGHALDQALEHRREELRLSRKAGPRPGETDKDFAYRMEELDRDTAKLVALVEDRRNQFTSSLRALLGDRMGQARRALGLELLRQAVDEILLATPADVLGAEGIRMELELLLSLGRAQEVRGILSDRGLRASKHALGYTEIPAAAGRNTAQPTRAGYRWPAYEWLHVLEGAAVGDYAQCRDDLRALRAEQRARQEQMRRQAQSIQNSIPALLPSLMSGPKPFLPASAALALALMVDEKRALDAGQKILDTQQADVYVLEGLLALEQGDVGTARSAFTEAQKIGESVSYAGRPIAVDYLGKLRR